MNISASKRLQVWLVLPLLAATPALAQPDIQNAPKADNPANRPVRPNLQNLPPEERIKERNRRQLELMGVTAPATQNALLAYIESETAARQTLLEKAWQLQIGLRGQALSDAQVATMLNDYLAAIEEDKTRRETAQTTLKKTVEVAKMPKVEAMLTLMGLWGNAPAMLSGGGLGMGNTLLFGFRNGPIAPNGGALGPQPTMPRLNRRRLMPPANTPPAAARPAGAQV
ncbi:MAG TPA: hypothetical protein VF627_13645 [Abditibacterium sp.]|jgi:hypothetical protein